MFQSPSTLLPPGLLIALFWALVVACVVAQAFIVRAVFRTLPTTPTSNAVPAPRRWAEVVQVLLPIVGLVAVFLIAWRALPLPIIP
ncbi:MAG: hypothetical protein IBJ03_10145 [Gemmatimonadaceae bacterium]|nr:hypothetical protein [Gemmatimonadaceae bacterium]